MKAALAGVVMLIIGDSHIATTEHFNNLLHDELLNQGASVHTFGVCNSSPDDWIVPATIVCGRGERHDAAPAIVRSEHWLRGWALPELIARYNPNLVVIELGDTMAGYGVAPELPRTRIAEQVWLLLESVRSRNLPCIWIGPPWGGEGGPYKKTYARVKELSGYLSQLVAPCRYIDSLRFSQPGQWPTRDGVHLTQDATRRWDADLVRSIDQIVAGQPRP